MSRAPTFGACHTISFAHAGFDARPAGPAELLLAANRQRPNLNVRSPACTRIRRTCAPSDFQTGEASAQLSQRPHQSYHPVLSPDLSPGSVSNSRSRVRSQPALTAVRVGHTVVKPGSGPARRPGGVRTRRLYHAGRGPRRACLRSQRDFRARPVRATATFTPSARDWCWPQHPNSARYAPSVTGRHARRQSRLPEVFSRRAIVQGVSGEPRPRDTARFPLAEPNVFSTSRAPLPYNRRDIGGALFKFRKYLSDVSSMSLPHSQHEIQDFNYMVARRGTEAPVRGTPVGTVAPGSAYTITPYFYGFRASCTDCSRRRGPFEPQHGEPHARCRGGGFFTFFFSIGQTF